MPRPRGGRPRGAGRPEHPAGHRPPGSPGRRGRGRREPSRSSPRRPPGPPRLAGRPGRISPVPRPFPGGPRFSWGRTSARRRVPTSRVGPRRRGRRRGESSRARCAPRPRAPRRGPGGRGTRRRVSPPRAPLGPAPPLRPCAARSGRGCGARENRPTYLGDRRGAACEPRLGGPRPDPDRTPGSGAERRGSARRELRPDRAPQGGRARPGPRARGCGPASLRRFPAGSAGGAGRGRDRPEAGPGRRAWVPPGSPPGAGPGQRRRCGLAAGLGAGERTQALEAPLWDFPKDRRRFRNT